MRKGLILVVIALSVFGLACKKPTSTQYCYKLYDFDTRYLASGTPADSFHVVDSSSINCYSTFRGDTTNVEVFSTWTLNSYPNGTHFYFKGTTYEVYQH